jgi:hypothetical protein
VFKIKDLAYELKLDLLFRMSIRQAVA